MRAALTTAIAAALLAVVAGPAAATVRLPAQIWAVQLPASGATVSPAYLENVRATGVNAIVVDGASFSSARLTRTRSAIATAGGLEMLASYAADAHCPTLRAPALCATKASSVTAALEAARRGAPPVVFPLAGLAQVSALAAARGRIVAVVPYRMTAGKRRWSAAIAIAGRSSGLDLAVAAPSARLAPAARAFPGAPGPQAGAPPPAPAPRPGPTPTPAPPGQVTNLHAETVGATSADLAWDAPAGDVDHFELFANGVRKTISTTTRATVPGLTCTASNVLGVEAVDTRGSHSQRATLTVMPPCGGGGGGGAPAPTPPPTTPPPPPSPPADTTPPVVTILSGPPTLTGSTTAMLSFTGNELSTYMCALAGSSGASGTYVGCTSPVSYSALADGSYTLSVKATDAAGNTSAAPATYSWTVDTTAPQTTLTAAPPATSPANVSFSFASSESASTFTCSSDGAPATACSAPKSYFGLANGSHTFSVRATDALGHSDASPATFSWTVNTTLTANLFMSPNGSDSNTCASPAAACKTFNGAFLKASSGYVVELAGGTYSAGSIANRPAITSAVTFQPAAGATVLLSSDLDIEASHVHVIGVRSAGTGNPASGPDNSRVSLSVCENACATPLIDVYVEGFSGKSAFIRSSGVTIEGGEFGNYDPCADAPGTSPTSPNRQNPEDVFRIWGATGAASTPTNVVVDGTLIHDDDDHHDSSGACPGATNGSAGEHVDCLQAQGGVNITIQNVVMWNCATSNIQAQPFNGTTMSNWTVQNNFFGKVLHPGNSVVLGGGASGSSCTSIVLRYNVIAGPQPNASGCATSGVGDISAYGNLFLSDATALGTNVTYAWNVFSAGTTAALNTTGDHNNKKCAVLLAGASATWPSGPNYHLLAGDTCAKAAGDAASYPATDIDGDARPSSGATAPDAGADEIS